MFMEDGFWMIVDGCWRYKHTVVTVAPAGTSDIWRSERFDISSSAVFDSVVIPNALLVLFLAIKIRVIKIGDERRPRGRGVDVALSATRVLALAYFSGVIHQQPVRPSLGQGGSAPGRRSPGEGHINSPSWKQEILFGSSSRF
jgi:hypothetical protein